MSGHNIASRAAVIKSLIASPPMDIASMREAFAGMVSKQWQRYVLGVLTDFPRSLSDAQLKKVRFVGEMYARACYSMLLISASCPSVLRLLISSSALLPQSRSLIIRLGAKLLAAMEQLVPRTVHRQLLLTSALMAMLDVVLDEAASSGEAAVFRVSLLITQRTPEFLLPAEQLVTALAGAARRDESSWQSEYWEKVLEPAVHSYCSAELLAIRHASDPSGMGHRWPGIDAAIKGMWYAVGPSTNLQGSPSQFDEDEWNSEQRWMADTSLLMQMIDDWVDQDEDRGQRTTPVVTGDWDLQSISNLYEKTVRDLSAMLIQNGIRRSMLQDIFTDLYNDYLHRAIDAMRSGMAA